MITVEQHYSVEQHELGATVEKFLASNQPLASVRALMESEVPFDSSLWRRASRELGLTALAVPEEYGGQGYGFAEVSQVLAAAGRSLTVWPYLSTVVLGGFALTLSGDREAAQRWFPSLASGELLATACLGGTQHPRRDARVVASAHQAGQWTVDGVESFVVDGQLAELIFVFAETEFGPTMFAVESIPGTEDVRRSAHVTLDGTRGLDELVFCGAKAVPVGRPGDGDRIRRDLSLVGKAALACEQLGGIETTSRRTVEYAKLRFQFGRSIGSFQVIKHRCADMYIRWQCAACFVDNMSLQMDYALRDSASDINPVHASTATAAIYCARSYIDSVNDMIQIHGGIGYTWEHDAHLFLRRALSTARLFGGVESNERYLESLIRNGGIEALEAARDAAAAGSRAEEPIT